MGSPEALPSMLAAMTQCSPPSSAVMRNRSGHSMPPRSAAPSTR